MDKQFERIQNILGKKIQCNRENALKFLDYLSKAVTKPCIVTGKEEFIWERYYIDDGWDDGEYKELKKIKPSFVDYYELSELLPPLANSDDIIAKVKRVSDKKLFEIGLSLLECTEFQSENYQLIDDYSRWHSYF